MQVYRVKLPKQHLAALPEADRKLFLLLGHVSNEINVLQKLILMLRREDAPSSMVDIVEAGQAMIVLRNLIGKLHEAYRLFNEQVQGNKEIRERFGIAGEWSGRQPLIGLNRMFGKGSLLTLIRQRIAFHYVDEDDLVEGSFQALSEDEPWEVYLSDTVANSFYYVSEMVVMKAALDLVTVAPVPNEPHDQTKLKKLFDETIAAAKNVMRLSNLLMIEILRKSLSGPLEIEQVEMRRAPKLSDVHLPFFVDDDELPEQPH